MGLLTSKQKKVNPRIKERQFVLVHELYEHKLMARGLGYEDAHQQASNRELEARKYPNELKGFLDMEGWC